MTITVRDRKGRNTSARRPIEDRLWEKVDKNGPTLNPSLGPCWIFTGAKDKAGYGKLAGGGQRGGAKLAHRVAWELLNGPIPDGLDVLHKCDNPPCVRHLYLGDAKANMDDARAKGRWSPRHGKYRRGQSHHSSKLSPAQVIEIRRRRASGESQYSLASRFGISRITVSNIEHRKIWSHIK